jgi:hypothetical protein
MRGMGILFVFNKLKIYDLSKVESVDDITAGFRRSIGAYHGLRGRETVNSLGLRWRMWAQT